MLDLIGVNRETQWRIGFSPLKMSDFVDDVWFYVFRVWYMILYSHLFMTHILLSVIKKPFFMIFYQFGSICIIPWCFYMVKLYDKNLFCKDDSLGLHHTIVCWILQSDKNMQHRRNISSRFTVNSKAFASEFTVNLEEMFSCYLQTVVNGSRPND